MSIVTFNGIRNNGTPITVNLYRGNNGVITTYPKNEYLYTSASAIEYALRGVFDSTATYFTHRNADTEFLTNKGFSNVITLNNGNKLIFPNGRQIRFLLDSSDNYSYGMTFVYSFSGRYLELSVGGDGREGNVAPTHDDYGKRNHYAIGLLSDRVMTYISTRGTESSPPIVDESISALMFPAVTMFYGWIYPGLSSDRDLTIYSASMTCNPCE